MTEDIVGEAPPRKGHLQRIVGQLLAEGGSLKQRAIRSSVWVLLGNGVSQMATLLRSIILARLLAPDDFGVMAVAVMVLGGLDAFTQTGYQAALIHRSGDIQRYLNTTFTIQVFRGFFLAGLMVAIAPVLGEFFHNARAVPVVRAISIAICIQGFVNPATVLFQKELNFKRQVYWNLSDTFTGLTVGIILAFTFHNVWALVGAYIASAIAKTTVSFLMHEFCPRFSIDWSSARELTRYGRWVFGTNLLAYVSTNMDLAVVGRLLGMAGTGFYQIAYRIANLPATAMSQVFSNVAFPLYAKMQSDRVKLRQIFFLGLDAALLIGLPMALFLCVLSKPLTVLVLGKKWLPASVALQFLAFYGFQRTIAGLGGVLFAGIGHPACDTKMNFFRFVALAGLIYPCTRFWGLGGACFAAVVSIFVTLPYWLNRSASFLNLRPGSLLRHSLTRSAPGLLGCGVPLVTLHMILPIERVWALLLTIFLTLLIYGAFNYRRFRQLIGDTLSAQKATEATD